MQKLMITIGMFIIIIFFQHLSAQEKPDSTNAEREKKIKEIEQELLGLNESFLEIKSVVDILEKIKVSGYIQAQYQTAESEGVDNFSGGNFENDMQSRFMLRRGRIKFNYLEEFSEYTLQFDITEKGLSTKDVYIILKEPWYQIFQIQAGIFNRPFGYEIDYSSSKRESPERSRLFQSLFPGERDLGIAMTIKSERGIFSIINFNAGFFSGNGIAKETDDYKDFIGRIDFKFPIYETNMSIDFGASCYLGKVRVPEGKSLYKINSANQASLVENQLFAERNYLGLEAQFYYASPFLGGLSLRGEYIQGTQPGDQSKNVSFTSAPSNDVFLREFAGYYLLFIQNIGKWNQFILKYDCYDPNTNIENNEIGYDNNSKTGVADVEFSTFGLGWIYYLDANIKLTLFYEKVDNETSTFLSDFYEDIKDDIFTFRIQYKF